jgi:putative flippase GtrA
MASVIPEGGNSRRNREPAVILGSPMRSIALLQVGLYLVVGAFCCFVDIGGFVALSFWGFPILSASALSFVTATLINYSLCCSFVFRSGRYSRLEEIVRLFVIAGVGLVLNSAMVMLLAELLGLNPTLAKFLAVFPVFVWNYFGRRALVFDGSPPIALTVLTNRVRERLSS